MRSTRSVLGIVMLGVAVLAACRTDPNDTAPSGDARAAIPAAPPSITGIITAVQPDGRLRIEENPDESSGSAKAVVRLSDDVTILTRAGAPATIESIRSGTRVSAWFNGPVMESYPVQTTANVIVIESGNP